MSQDTFDTPTADCFPMHQGQTHSPLVYRIEVSLLISGKIEVNHEVRYVHERNDEGLRLPLSVPGPFWTLPSDQLDPKITRSLLRLPPPWSAHIASSGEEAPRRLDSQAYPDYLAMAICYASPGQVKRLTKSLHHLIADWCREQSRLMRLASRQARGSWWPW